MITQNHIIFPLILLSLFSIQTYAVVYCKNSRACPDNYACSYDGDYCCKDGLWVSLENLHKINYFLALPRRKML